MGLMLGSKLAMAQLCTGSLGDPVVNITFGSGTSTHAAALGSDFTSYTYSSADFPIDGSYTVENTTAGAGATWWSTTDHTGNTGGYMMVVNASLSTTDYFYKSTITGLCPGTTYEFKAWVVNLLRSRDISPPDITFLIEKPDGTVIKSLNTGSIPLTTDGPHWVPEGMLFTTPAGVSDIVIRMRNNSSGGAPANDLALDDITFRPCGPIITSTFGATSTTALTGCAGTNQTYTLKGDPSSGYTNPAYQWQVLNAASGWTDIPGATSTTYTLNFAPAVAGTYQYRLVSAEADKIGSVNCQVVSNVLTLTINSSVATAPTVNSPVCYGGTINLNAVSADNYEWTGPNGFTSSQQSPAITNATTANSGTYHLKTTKNTCEASFDVPVTVNPQVVATASAAATTICQGDQTTLSATGGGSYSWSPATGLSNANVANPVATPAQTTTYTVTVTNGSCSNTASATINVIPKPTVDAGADKKITQGQSVTLDGKATYATYYWTPADYLSNANILNPIATPPSDITYTLHAVPVNGCGTEITDNVFVRVYTKVTIPNTFTPNGDGKHDIWDIEGLITYPTSTTQVFNRYGKVVFASTGYAQPWDGRMNGENVPEGTYYYKIDLKNGNVFAGWVAIVR
ncbi:gliding motility-associated-like protein [Mucilaginibacter yixingensis]|uniref:Gliding motility-associated-like protein n=2 Tax=Mucilaginibacter yixingensis TaxID=1295612 RepID=A0A2T5J5D6_9SPHI|nr:gliding motility-associated-like protein [Mucilaginibacter yixingensis]